jgi:hypothetical protein
MTYLFSALKKNAIPLIIFFIMSAFYATAFDRTAFNPDSISLASWAEKDIIFLEG